MLYILFKYTHQCICGLADQFNILQNMDCVKTVNFCMSRECVPQCASYWTNVTHLKNLYMNNNND